MPTFNDLYYTDLGNAKLNPEYATQYDLGAQYDNHLDDSWLTGFGMSVDAYYNEVTDKIISVPKGTGQYRWMMMNIGRVKIHGVDVIAKMEMKLPENIGLTMKMNYTYQRALDYTDPSDNGDGGTYKGMIAYVPQHSGSVAAAANWHNLGLNYSFIYVGERYHTSANTRENYEQPWYTHDVSIMYDFILKNLRLGLTLEVNNLFNQQYDVIKNYPMPGRNYKAVIKIDF